MSVEDLNKRIEILKAELEARDSLISKMRESFERERNVYLRVIETLASARKGGDA